MKTINVSTKIAILIAVLAVYSPALAQVSVEVETTSSGDNSLVQDVRATLKARVQTDEDKAKIQAESDIRARILRDQAQQREENRENRDDIREERLENTRTIKNERRENVRNASSTAERWGIRHQALLEAFRARQTAFVKQLQLSIRNLEQISGRIAERISKAEQSGRDMTTPKNLLINAKVKIETAKTAVNAVASYTPPATTTNATSTNATSTNTTNATSTVVVDLTKPRSIGSEATKAIHDARRALQDVVVSIAHNMGLKVGVDGKISTTTNATTTATTTTSTATSTATSTGSTE